MMNLVNMRRYLVQKVFNASKRIQLNDLLTGSGKLSRGRPHCVTVGKPQRLKWTEDVQRE